MPDTVPTDGMLPPFVPLHTVDGEPVSAVRARMSGALIARFPCQKPKDDQYGPLDVMGYSHADQAAVLAAADGGGAPGSALWRRFTDHLRSTTEVISPLASSLEYLRC